MRRADWERFDARSVEWFFRLFGAALVANVVTEIRAGVWRVHTGELYPWRHLPIVPLTPPAVLAGEWACVGAAGIAMAIGVRRALAVRVAAPALLLGVLERFSNHASLMFLVAFFVALAPPPDVRAEDFAERQLPNLALVRAQLAIVYVFSALNKIARGFLGGASLVNLFGWSPRAAVPLSIAVVVAELALPVALVVAPRVGIAGVALLQIAFATQLPGLWSFTLTMIAMAVLFVPPPPQIATRGPRSP